VSEAILLKQIEERVNDLWTEAERLTPLIPADAPWKQAFVQFQQAAKAVLEKSRSPVKIGVVGEFSAGKTLLLGSLIGYADALPVKEIATTGNVTALRFTPVDGIATTRVGPYTIEFLNHQEFEDCLAFLLKQAGIRAKAAELNEELREKLVAIKGSDTAAPSKVDEWAKSAWTATSNPALKYSIRELVRFVRAYMRCGAGLCGSEEPFEVPVDVAVNGLQLEAIHDNIQSMMFSDIPSPKCSISTRPTVLTAEQIRDAFPLIRLVTVDVQLATGLWNFSGLGADRFILMDFPGLGADSSGVRDLYLCLRELEKIQTVLILLNGRKPGGDQGLKIYNLLQEHRPGQDIRDMVLVGIGRFDQLPLGAEGETKLRELAAVSQQPIRPRSRFGDDEDEEAETKPVSAGPLTDKDVRQALPILNSAIAGAEALVPPGRTDRIVFLSPLLHLKMLEDRNVGLQVGSEAFMANARQEVENAVALAPLWRSLSERLKGTKPETATKSVLAKWLADYAEDGGISRLRGLILSHVQGAGFAQLLRDTLQDFERLKTAQQQFRDSLPSSAAGWHDSRTVDDKIAAAERALAQLAEFYQNQIQQLKNHPKFSLTIQDNPITLEELLLEEVAFHVNEWPLWDTLFQNVKAGKIVEPTVRKGRNMFGHDDDEDESDTQAFPTRAEDFYPAFEETINHLNQFVRHLIDRGVAEFIQKLSAPAEALRLIMGTSLDRKTLAKEVRALNLGAKATDLVGALRAAVNPTHRMKIGLFRSDDAVNDPAEETSADLPLTPLDPAKLFPLARSTKDSPGRVFGWAAKLQEVEESARPEPHLAHPAMVLRIRDELMRVLRQQSTQLLSEGVQIVIHRLIDKLSTVYQKLTIAHTNRIVLETLLTEASTATDAAAPIDELQPFRRLAKLALSPTHY
jgi:hypothetical protein